MKPNKFLGQNFLTSKKIVAEIIKAADLKSDDIVLEVGPGKGILTEAILEKIPQGKLIAIEKDKRLVELLLQKFCYSENLVIVHDDILKFDPLSYGLMANGYKIVANLPYYITSHFLRIFLQSNFSPTRMVLMVQKEVAERITCPERSRKDCKESILSVSVKAYGNPKIIKRVPAEYFSPKPKVDSAILLIDNISKDFFRNCATLNVAQHEKKFFELVKRGFSSKRKMLKNNLKMSNTRCLTECGISENARAEDLDLKNWKCLLEKI
ncbi:ribosomal RNA small subunit methyltransferase A [Patescibacteria group bacterium]|nr:ribosomal RNA small subunit methyltransferase A [Patescibacteria group bacterium]